MAVMSVLHSGLPALPKAEISIWTQRGTISLLTSSNISIASDSNFCYISTNSIAIREKYNKTLNTLFELMQLSENENNIPKQLFLPETENKYQQILDTFKDEMIQLKDEDKDKLIVRHICYHMYKLFFTLLNVHIFNKIRYYIDNESIDITNIDNESIDIDITNITDIANNSLVKCISDIRTKFALNTNSLDVEVIKDTLNENIIFQQ